MSEPGHTEVKEKKKVKASHIVFLLICFIAACALAWWQWSRFQSGTGTFQNLGYAFQWPIIGGFFVYAYRKYLQYENESIELENLEAQMMAEHGELPDARPQHEEGFVQLSNRPSLVDDDSTKEIDESFLPSRPTMNVEEFNRLNDPNARRRRKA
ncbi:hypothetical protein [Corynebacterium crudilactis]|uniref:Uncharacterized protein n=1 Tax=Corynebacterium crudilactis TaxID=1652495 RepID=A0A172QVH9_9CORY|nr:hypothetical protein [Corynebacterium crudilactis]ANE04717.1 hypothetical protein ccrud_11245 [Corynebacterium crudilactis]